MSLLKKIRKTIRTEINFLFFREFRYKRKVWRHLRQYYTPDAPRKAVRRGLVVVMADGRCHHGGLCDRLRTYTAAYRYCMAHGLQFAIYHRFPFRLEDYLEPVSYDWRMPEDELSFNSGETDVLYTDTTGEYSERELRFRDKVYRKFLRGNHHPQHHFYSSFADFGEEFGPTFRDLFRPVEHLRNLIDRESAAIAGPYVAVATRFLDLLGDFREPKNYKKLSKPERDRLIDRCVACIAKIHHEWPGRKILVTSDSSTFLAAASALPYVYVIDGLIAHVDTADSQDHTKTFLDFFMLGKAEKVYQLQIGPMYSGFFSRSAALAGGAPYERIVERF